MPKKVSKPATDRHKPRRLVGIPEDLGQRLQKRADSHGITFAACVANACELYLLSTSPGHKLRPRGRGKADS